MPGVGEAQAAGSPVGQTFDLSNQGADFAMQAIEKAFDFRGDVTLTLKDGRAVSGYLFDRSKGKGLADSYVRLMPTAQDQGNQKICYADIKLLAFSDRDPAAGKSFETWVKKYVEKKMAGERASIESEALD